MQTFRQYLCEMDQRIAKDVSSWWEENAEELPFANIFGDKLRLFIPYTPTNDTTEEISNVVKLTGAELDPKSGMVKKNIISQGRSDKTQDTKIGKYLEKIAAKARTILKAVEQNDQQTLDNSLKSVGLIKNADQFFSINNPNHIFSLSDIEKWTTYPEQWNKQSGSFYLVISRHPIDVLRMSDFQNIQSCHSQGGSYFHCAVTEAKGGGAIAYLIKKNDLKRFTDTNDLQNKEIFKDVDRNIPGITPISRLRIRLFKHKKQNYDFAVPEKNTYGSRQQGFKNAVLDWARDTQKDIFKKRPNLKEFARYGGSYQDSTYASPLFNQFFQDQKDSGDADYEGEEDYTNLIDQYEEECRAIDETYRNEFKHSVGGYYSVEEDDGQPYVYYSGRAKFFFPAQAFIKTLPSYGAAWEERRRLTDAFKDNIKNAYFSEVEFNEDGDKSNISIDFNMDSDGDMTPDGYRDFLYSLQSDWDDNYEKIQTAIYSTCNHWDISENHTLPV